MIDPDLGDDEHRVVVADRFLTDTQVCHDAILIQSRSDRESRKTASAQ